MTVKRIALLHPYIGEFAEKESSLRMIAASRNIGVETREFYRSEDLFDFQPDLVLSFTHQDAKLTHFPTYGVLNVAWNYYRHVPRFIRNILSYDACLTASEKVRQHLEDLLIGSRKYELGARVAHFAVTVQATEYHALDFSNPRLAYFGTNWDGKRFGKLFTKLADRGYLRIHGPEAPWQHLPAGVYGGRVPFDGVSVLDAYRQTGVGLSLYLPAYAEDGVPNNRIFEIVASGALAISGRNAFVERYFGDSVLYVDQASLSADLASQIDAHMAWIRANPEEAARRARRAHEIFNERLCGERMLSDVIAWHEEISSLRGYDAPRPPLARRSRTSTATPKPTVSIIVRAGGRPIEFLDRALASVARQTYGEVQVLLVLYRDLDYLDELRARHPGLAIRVLRKIGGNRSETLWHGLAHVDTDLFGMLDDDDELFPTHVDTLVRTLMVHNGGGIDGPYGLAHGVAVEVAESGTLQETMVDPHVLRRNERMRLGPFEPHDPERFRQGGCNLQPNLFLARSDLLDAGDLVCPGFEIGEDYYFFRILASKTRFAFASEVVCYSHQHDHPSRSDYQNNVAEYEDKQRMLFRLWGRTSATDGGPVYLPKWCHPFLTAAPHVVAAGQTVSLSEHIRPAAGAAAERDGVRIAAEAPAGLVAASPAMDFAEGRYTLGLAVSAGECQAGDVFRLDVVSNGGANLIHRETFSLAQAAPGQQPWPFRYDVNVGFSVRRDDGGVNPWAVEFRIVRLAPCALVVEEMTVRSEAKS